MGALAVTDPATLQARLADLEATKHALLTGKARVSVGHDGKSVTFSKADLPALNAEIAAIKTRLGQGRRRAIGVQF